MSPLFVRRLVAAVGLSTLALLAGCASFGDDEGQGDDVVLSPSAILVPQIKVIPTAEAFAEQRAAGFVLMNEGNDMLPRYTPGTAFVVERGNYKTLRRGMTVVIALNSRRVAHQLISKKSGGWITRGLSSRVDDPSLMTPETYLGTVMMAFSPETNDAAPRRLYPQKRANSTP